MAAKPHKQDDPAQSRRFVELAIEREAEGDDETLARAVKKLAPHRREQPKPGKKSK
jgi:hypothetical protein